MNSHSSTSVPMGGPELAPSPPSAAVMGSARATMWALMAIPWFATHVVRRGFPILVEFIVKDLGFSDAQKAQLLGSFFPGCALKGS